MTNVKLLRASRRHLGWWPPLGNQRRDYGSHVMAKATLLEIIRRSAATEEVPIGSQWPTIEKYVATGDPSLLKSLRAVQRYLYWTLDKVLDVFADPCLPTDEERRVLEVFAGLGWHHWVLPRWLNRALASKAPADEELHALWRGMYDPDHLPADVAKATVDVCADLLDRDGRPSSAGRFVLSLPDADMEKVIRDTREWKALASFLLTYAPDRAFRFFDPLVRRGMYRVNVDAQICRLLLSRDSQRYEAPLAALFREEPALAARLCLGEVLTDFNRAKYGEETSRIARELLEQSGYDERMEASLWLLRHHGKDALADVSECVRRWTSISWVIWAGDLFSKASELLGRESRPLALSILELTGEIELALREPVTNVVSTVSVIVVGDPASTALHLNNVRFPILSKLIEWNNPADRAVIAQHVQAGFR